MFGINEMRERFNALVSNINYESSRISTLRKDVEFVMQVKNNEIKALNRKVDTLLDYLGLEYFPERVFIDCIEEKQNKKGKK